MSSRHLVVVLVVAVLGISACSGDTEHNDKHGIPQPTAAAKLQGHNDEPDHEELPRRLRLEPQVIKDAKIQTAPVVREVLAATIDLPGEVTADPDKTARVSALVAGRIELVIFKEGQHVNKADLLAVVKVPELGKIRSAFASATAKANAAKSNADRLRSLRTARLSGEQEVLNAEADARALEADARAVSEQLSAMGMVEGGTGALLNVRAPSAGVVVAREAVMGQPVTSDQVIATIVDLDEVWFLGRVFEKNLGQVHLGAAAEIVLNAYPNERFSGSIEYVGKQIDPVARTVVARIRVMNRGELLRLGLFGVARVRTGEVNLKNELVTVVPRNSVTEIGGKPVVFVQQADGDFDLHEVVLGEGAGGKVQVLNGLREGERVVVDGVFTLKSVVLKSAFGDEE